jgi:hypothetical protein
MYLQHNEEISMSEWIRAIKRVWPMYVCRVSPSIHAIILNIIYGGYVWFSEQWIAGAPDPHFLPPAQWIYGGGGGEGRGRGGGIQECDLGSQAAGYAGLNTPRLSYGYCTPARYGYSTVVLTREEVFMEGPIEPNMGPSLADVLLCTFESTNAGFSSFPVRNLLSWGLF